MASIRIAYPVLSLSKGQPERERAGTGVVAKFGCGIRIQVFSVRQDEPGDGFDGLSPNG